MTLVAWLTFALRLLASLPACWPAANHSAGVLGPAAGTAMGLPSITPTTRARTFLTNGIASLLSRYPRHFTLMGTDCKEWGKGMREVGRESATIHSLPGTWGLLCDRQAPYRKRSGTMPVAELFCLTLLDWDDLPGVIVAVLLRVEHPPAEDERVWIPGTEDATRRRVTVRDVEAGDLVVPVVLEPVARDRADAGVDRGGGVAPFGQDAERLVDRVGVVERDIEQVGRVESVPLRVQGVAGVLDEDDFVLRPEPDVIKPAVGDVAPVEDGQPPVNHGRVGLGQFENGAETAESDARLSERVGVAGLVEEEFCEVGARPELAVLRPLERRRVIRLRQRVGVERGGAINGGVVDSDPAGDENLPVGVQVLDVLREDVCVHVTRVEDNRPALVVQHLQGLQLAPLREVITVVGDEAVEETVGLLGVWIDGAGLAADVFNDPEIAVRVVLDAFVAAAPNSTRYAFHSRRIVRCGLPN